MDDLDDEWGKGRNSSVKAMMKKNSMAFEEKNKQTAPLGATK